MKFYHGTYLTDFVIENHIDSRYGFKCLFLTNNLQLAKLYAKYHSDKKKCKGSVYVMDLPIGKTYDFNFGLTYSALFRNLIYSLFEKEVPSVLIKNVIDYPSDKFKDFIISDILVVFDLAIIQNVEYGRIG